MNTDKLDFSRLLGFSVVSDKLSDNVDFRDETVAATIGAKIGTEVDHRAAPAGVDTDISGK